MDQEEVDLILKSISQGFDKTQAELDKTSKSVDNLEKTNKEASSKIANAQRGVKLAFTELNSALDLVQKGVQIAGQVYEQTAGKAYDYSMKVGNLAQNLGIGVEETSRMIQISDDYGISIDQVTTALQMWVKRGTKPSIDELANLADAYVNTLDPNERANLLTEKLGKNWTVLTPLLKQGGQAIRDNSKAINDNLLITEKNYQDALAMQAANDSLGDSFEGLKIKIGKGLLPELVDVTQFANRLIEAWDNSGGSFGGFLKYLAQSRQGFTYYTDGAKTATKETRALTGAVVLTEEELQQVYNWDAKLEAQSNATADAIMVQKNQMYQLANSGSYAAEVLKGLKTAQERLAQAQDSWNQGTAQDAVNALDKTNRHYDRYLIGLSLIDRVFGSHTRMQEEYNRAIQKAGEQYQKTGDMNTYYQALQNIKTTFGEQASPILEAKADVDKYNSALAAIPDRVDTYIYTHHIDLYGSDAGGGKGGRGGGAASGEGHKGVDEEFATGVKNFTVPSNYPNDSFRVGLTSGETVTVMPPGGQDAGGGSVISVGDINVIAAPGMDENSLANLVVKKLFATIKREKATGARYSTG